MSRMTKPSGLFCHKCCANWWTAAQGFVKLFKACRVHYLSPYSRHTPQQPMAVQLKMRRPNFLMYKHRGCALSPAWQWESLCVPTLADCTCQGLPTPGLKWETEFLHAASVLAYLQAVSVYSHPFFMAVDGPQDFGLLRWGALGPLVGRQPRAEGEHTWCVFCLRPQQRAASGIRENNQEVKDQWTLLAWLF